MIKIKRIANKPIPIEAWGDLTGLREELELHLKYGGSKSMVKNSLSTFREYIRDN
jgi:hypothetical protein